MTLPKVRACPWVDLPAIDCRWVASRKMALIEAIEDDSQPKITDQSVMDRYGISADELNEWYNAYVAQGIQGLKVSGCQKS